MKRLNWLCGLLLVLVAVWASAGTGDLVKDGIPATELMGGIKRFSLVSSTNISGSTLFGTVFQTLNGYSQVTGTVTQSMNSAYASSLIMFQNAVTGTTKASVKLPSGDSVIGFSAFNPTVNYFEIAAGGWLTINGTGGTSIWFVSGVSGVSIKQF